MCRHPALTRSSAIALTLRAVGGLSTSEIARAFMVPEATMAQRISRAKQLIKKSGVRFGEPTADERDERLGAVLHVLYLIFNEGYASSAGPSLQRVDLSSEAIRLSRAVHHLLPGDAEVAGLLALLLLTDARRAARTGPDGELIPLDEQDRTLWDRGLIAEGVALISDTLSRGAGEGVPALVAEILVAEVALHLGLPVPERALIELPRGVPSDDRNDELSDLLGRSAGTNVGVRFLDGASEADPRQLALFDDDFVARVLWLDGLVMNADRSVQNPNILVWKHQPWLIDHGSSLTFHHDWERLTENSPGEGTNYANHVFGERRALLDRYDSMLIDRLSRDALRAAVEMLPDEFVADVGPGAMRGGAALSTTHSSGSA